jgi:hypothetical protein
VVLTELRARVGWDEGTPPVLVERRPGWPFSPAHSCGRWSDLSGLDLVGELTAERRDEASAGAPPA